LKISNLFLYSGQIYRAIIILGSALILTYFFPKTLSLKQTFKEGEIWNHPDVHAPFDFTYSISNPEINDSSSQSIKNLTNIISNKFKLSNDSIQQLSKEIHSFLQTSDSLTYKQKRAFSKYISLKYHLDSLLIKQFILDSLINKNSSLGNHLIPKKILRNQLIIQRNERIDHEKFIILNTLKNLRIKTKTFRWFTLGGFFILTILTLLLLLYFYKNFYQSAFINNQELSIIIFNFTLTIFLIFIVQKYLPFLLYATPVIILPIIIKTFFDDKMAVVTSISAFLLAAFGLYRPFEFIFIQTGASLAAILIIKDITNRSRLFLSMLKIVLIYTGLYLIFLLIQYGGIEGINYYIPLFFAISGVLAIAFIHELILLIEKIYGIASDVSLLELQNTNNKLLRLLAEKAPGTFQHSMQVANLAESIANEIGADSMLVRVGALYHDIGKLKNPKYFTENQTSGVNPHDKLTPEQSAKIIIAHVLDGIEMARKNNIPERIVDFIRTHHGTGLVYYFYKKALEQNPEVDESKFRYPGPNPFSKETAILMMADSVEAASKSLKNPTSKNIIELVDKIINKQVQEGLFNNANITLKEINKAKKILKTKLKSIYHTRVEYPE